MAADIELFHSLDSHIKKDVEKTCTITSTYEKVIPFSEWFDGGHYSIIGQGRLHLKRLIDTSV